MAKRTKRELKYERGVIPLSKRDRCVSTVSDSIRSVLIGRNKVGFDSILFLSSFN